MRENIKDLAVLLATANPSITSDTQHCIVLTFKDSTHMVDAFQLLIELLVTGQRLPK